MSSLECLSAIAYFVSAHYGIGKVTVTMLSIVGFSEPTRPLSGWLDVDESWALHAHTIAFWKKWLDVTLMKFEQ